MINIAIFMDYHGRQIQKYLLMNQKINKVQFIELNKYVASGGKY